MFASLLIGVLSFLLLIYWFRYSCLLVLRGYSQSDFTAAGDGRFSFRDVNLRLETASDLNPLHNSLQQDYRLLTYLLQHAKSLGAPSVELRLLKVDYRLMQTWFRLTRTRAPLQARRALSEMSSVVAFMARRISEQAASQSHI